MYRLCACCALLSSEMAERIRPRALNHEQFLQYISTSLRDINRQIQQSQSPDIIDNAVFRVDALIVNLNRMENEINDAETFSSINRRLTVSLLLMCVHVCVILVVVYFVLLFCFFNFIDVVSKINICKSNLSLIINRPLP